MSYLLDTIPISHDAMNIDDVAVFFQTEINDYRIRGPPKCFCRKLIFFLKSKSLHWWNGKSTRRSRREFLLAKIPLSLPWASTVFVEKIGLEE